MERWNSRDHTEEWIKTGLLRLLAEVILRTIPPPTATGSVPIIPNRSPQQLLGTILFIKFTLQKELTGNFVKY